MKGLMSVDPDSAIRSIATMTISSLPPFVPANFGRRLQYLIDRIAHSGAALPVSSKRFQIASYLAIPCSDLEGRTAAMKLHSSSNFAMNGPSIPRVNGGLVIAISYRSGGA